MKKTVSMLLAIIVAAIAICTFATSAFANPDETTTTTVANNGITDPDDGRLNPPTTKPTTTDEVVTLKPGQTVIDEGSTKAPTTAKPATTKKPAANVSAIPNTGSSAVAPVIALLALEAGAAAVVKTKKED